MSRCEGEQTPADLAEELRQLETQKPVLVRRTHSLELSGPLTLILLVAALALSIAALVVVVSNDSSGVGGSAIWATAGRAGMMSRVASQGMMPGSNAGGQVQRSDDPAGREGQAVRAARRLLGGAELRIGAVRHGEFLRHQRGQGATRADGRAHADQA